MEVIDNFGNVYSSVREFCRKKQCARTHVVEQLKKRSEYHNFKKGIAIKPVMDREETTLPTLPPPPPPKKREPSTPPAPPAEVDEEYEAFKAVRGTDFKFYTIEAPADKKGYRYAIALFSDAHIEESVDSDSVLGLNSYDTEVAEQRIKAYFANLANCLKKDNAQTLYFASLGDTISGFIHEHLMQENGMTPPEATLFGQSLIVSGLQHLRRELPNMEIYFIGIAGNHSRITKKVQNSNGFKMSYEWIMYQNVKQICEAAKMGIKFLIPESELALVQTPDGKRYIFCHGFQVQSKGTGTVAGIYPALGRLAMKWQKIFKQDKIFLGHYHTCVSIPTATVNGSVIGYNAFALTNGMGYEEPAQMYEVFDSEIGQLLSRKIYCK